MRETWKKCFLCRNKNKSLYKPSVIPFDSLIGGFFVEEFTCDFLVLIVVEFDLFGFSFLGLGGELFFWFVVDDSIFTFLLLLTFTLGTGEKGRFGTEDGEGRVVVVVVVGSRAIAVGGVGIGDVAGSSSVLLFSFSFVFAPIVRTR